MFKKILKKPFRSERFDTSTSSVSEEVSRGVVLDGTTFDFVDSSSGASTVTAIQRNEKSPSWPFEALCEDGR